MLRNRMILFLLANIFSVAAMASDLDFNLSDEAFLVRYSAPAGSSARTEFGFVHHKDDINIADLGLHLVDNAGSQEVPLQVGMGGRLVFADTKGPSGGGVALGAFVRYSFPTANRFAIGGSIHFAPDVTTFSDMDKYVEYNVRAEYEVLRNGSIYLGYRKIDAKFDNIGRTVHLDKGLHFGMHFTF